MFNLKLRIIELTATYGNSKTRLFKVTIMVFVGQQSLLCTCKWKLSESIRSLFIKRILGKCHSKLGKSQITNNIIPNKADGNVKSPLIKVSLIVQPKHTIPSS